MGTPPLMTAEDLLHVQIPNKRVELVRGVLVVSEPPGYFHGAITARLAKVLIDYADPRDLGRVLAGDAGFKLASDPDTVRGPDVAFIRRERQPHPSPRGFAAFPPDLIVEVLSPNDRPGQILAKVADWLSAGSTLVWVIDPDRRIARIYRADSTETTIGEREQLEGEDILPGFTYLLSEVLAD